MEIGQYLVNVVNIKTTTLMRQQDNSLLLRSGKQPHPKHYYITAVKMEKVHHKAFDKKLWLRVMHIQPQGSKQ